MSLKGCWFLHPLQSLHRHAVQIIFTIVCMWLAIVIVKSVVELSLMFTLGRFVLGLLIGERRGRNVFWQMLDIAARPALRLARAVSPGFVLDQHIPLVTVIWLVVVWVGVLQLKIEICLVAGANICK